MVDNKPKQLNLLRQLKDKDNTTVIGYVVGELDEFGQQNRVVEVEHDKLMQELKNKSTDIISGQDIFCYKHEDSIGKFLLDKAAMQKIEKLTEGDRFKRRTIKFKNIADINSYINKSRIIGHRVEKLYGHLLVDIEEDVVYTVISDLPIELSNLDISIQDGGLFARSQFKYIYLANTSIHGSMRNMFFNCSASLIDFTGCENSGISSMESAFEYSNILKSIVLNGLDTSKVESFRETFAGCNYLQSVDITSIDTQSAKDMNGMFQGCGELRIMDIRSLNIDNVKDFTRMFGYCSELREVKMHWSKELKPYDIRLFRSMFYYCYKLELIELDNFNFNIVDLGEVLAITRKCKVYVNGNKVQPI